jgi:hypothetical protein
MQHNTGIGGFHFYFHPYFFELGAGTGYWPDFYEDGCRWEDHTARARTNRLGNSLRWQPCAR